MTARYVGNVYSAASAALIEPMEVLSHSIYLAPVPLYAHLYASDGLVIDACSPFIKQTFRNRATIATECGELNLTIPVIHDAGTVAMKDVRISEHGNWRHKHWNALASAYRKSPFFDYYANDFAHFYEERNGFLMDFNLRLHAVICELLGIEYNVRIAYDKESMKYTKDLRKIAEPRLLVTACSIEPLPYYQVFGARNGFMPHLSIADLLFNMGPEALIVLRDMIKKNNSSDKTII